MARKPDDADGPSGGRGKWSEAGVPHRGWTCVEVEDLGEPSLICQMCDTREIRYVHFMSHSDYPDVLSCGCICAGHMEGDLVRAQGRERRMLNAAKRRAHWPLRKAWRLSRNGNPMIKVDGLVITVYPYRDGWRAVIVDSWSDAKVFSRRVYPTITSAQLAAFDRMILDK